MSQPSYTILILGGGRRMHASIQRALARGRSARYTCVRAPSAAAGRAICATAPPDAVLVCDPIPDASALELVAELSGAHGPLAFAIVPLLEGDEATATRALELGAHDCVLHQRGFGLAIPRALSSALAQVELRRQNAALRGELAAAWQLVAPAGPATQAQPALSQAVLDALHAHIAVLDHDGVIVAVNAAWRCYARENGLGGAALSRADVGASYLAACRAGAASGDPDASAAYHGIRGVLSGEQASFTLDYPCHTASEQQWFSMSVAQLGVPHSGAVVAHTRITRRKRAEQALARSKAQLAAIIESAMDAIVAVDGDQRIVSWNAAAVRMFGCAAADALGQPIERFIPQRAHAAHRAYIGKYSAGADGARPMSDRGPVAARRADGSEFLIEASISSVVVGGQPLLTAVLRDITAGVQAAARLEAQAAQLAQLHAVALDLTRLLDGPQVSAAILEHSMTAVGAQHGAVLRYQPGEPHLQLLAARGFSADNRAQLAALPFESETVFAEAIRTQRPVFVESPTERDACYPQLSRQLRSPGSAAAAFPLLADDQLIGSLGLIFDEPRRLTQEECAFLDTLAQQCAQALGRALLSDAIQAATRAKDEALALLDMLFASAPIGLAFLDREQRYVRINAALAAMNGRPVAEHLGRSVDEVLPQLSAQLVPPYQAVLASAQPIVNREISGPAVGATGELRHTLESYYPVAAPGAPPIGVGVIVNDVTDLRRASAALHDAEQKLTALINILPFGISILNHQGRITFSNPALEQILGMSHEQLFASEYTKHRYINADGTPMPIAAFASARAAAEQRLVQNVETGRINDDGSVTWLNVTAVPVTIADWHVVLTVSDITERVLAEQALQASRQRLAELSARLVHTQENERRALAYELHDEIGQQLTGLNLILESGARATATQLRAKLSEAQQLVNVLTGQVRQLSLDLRPPMIDDLGLLPTLQWQVQRYTQQTGVAVDFKHSGLDAALPPHVAISAFRIVQEALTNIARHAGTAAAAVRVWVSAGQLNLTIEDQGRGFDVAAWLPGRTVGLAGMRERAELLGGQLILDSTPGEGTRIRASLPINAIDE
jgi:PAS domain S-box-containing protein